MLKDDNEIKDVAWREVDIEEDSDNNTGQINFRRNRNKSRMKAAFKFIAMIVVAATSGAITAAYIVNTKYSDSTSKNNAPIFQKKKSLEESSSYDIPANSVNKVAEAVGPAVVGITNNADAFEGDSSKQSSGSGIIFKSDGYIVTNYHVIEGADKVIVKLSNGKNGRTFRATVIGTDATSDLAIVKIDANNLPTATFGDSSKTRVGDVAIAIGNPLGEEFEGSVTAGIISANNRNIDVIDEKTGEVTRYKVVQTDAAINPGNSGGALCNERGDVIGINSLKLGADYNVEGMGFAIPINDAKKIIDELLKNGKVIRPFLGIVSGTAIADKNNGVQGAYIKGVVPGSGAAKAGIKPTDIITEIDGIKVVTIDDIRDILERKKIGDKVPCKVYRQGKFVKVQIVLTENKE